MKKTFWTIILITFLGIQLNAQEKTISPSSSVKALNEDKQADTIISKRYADQEIMPNDSLLPVVIDSTQAFISNIPDSVYISRLRRIPSTISLTFNDIVKRYIEVYTVKKREKLQEMLSLKEYYFPIFEEVLDSYNMPLELKYLSVIESALNPKAVSRCGATGLWQFMYGTGRNYKLNINSFVDERREPYAATNAAARFLKDLYATYGDWVLAIAAYNCGPGNVNKAIHRSGGKTNYWDIYPYLPRETRGYVPAFIAATYAMNFYKDHNLTPIAVRVPPAADTIILNENIHLQQVSDVLNISMDELNMLNPQYRLNIVPGRYSTCILRLPENSATRFIDLQDSILRYKHDEFFSGDFKLITPTTLRNGKYASGPSTRTHQKILYTVKPGETLNSIAANYRVRLSDLRLWNNISRNSIRSGQSIVIFVSKKKGIPAPLVTNITPEERSTSVQNTTSEYLIYRVKSGDSLWKIASQYPGITDADIRKWNNLSNQSKITPGQTIKIKKMN